MDLGYEVHRFIEVIIIETSSLAVEIAEKRRAGEICEIVIEDLLVGVQLEIGPSSTPAQWNTHIKEENVIQKV